MSNRILFLVPLAGLLFSSACKKDEAAPKADRATTSSAASNAAAPSAAASSAAASSASAASSVAANDVIIVPSATASTAIAPEPSAKRDPLAKALGSTPSSPAVAATEPAFKLVAAGAEPRARLRYHLVKGATQSSVITMLVGQGNAPLAPFMTMGITSSVTDVLPDGRIRMDLKTDKFDLGEIPGMPIKREMGDAISKAMAGVKHHLVITDRGVVREDEVELPPGANPMLKQMLDGLKQSLSQTVPVLPDEPVGIGAKWELVNTISVNQGGMKLTLQNKAVYELVSRTGDVGKTNVTLTQTASPQPINSPMLPPGVKAEITAMTTNGTGSSDFDLAKLLPTLSNLKTATTMSLSIDGQPMTQMMNGEVKVLSR